MKVTKAFIGVPDGEVYPRNYAPGDDCPPELLAAAVDLGAVAVEEKADKPAENKARTKRETK